MTYKWCPKIDLSDRLADLTRKCLHAATVAKGRGDVQCDILKLSPGR